MRYYFIAMLSLLTISIGNAQTMYLNGHEYESVNGQWYQIENGRQYLVNNSVITVKFHESAYESQITNLNTSLGVQVLRVNMLGFYDLHIPAGYDPMSMVQEYQNSGLIDIAEPNTFGEYIGIPDDPRFSDQWHHNNENDHDIDSQEAWDWETGDPGVIIGILDSGTDILHEDLEDNIWVNSGEDIDQDGVVWDADDFNGVDDDGNGLVDDIVGWDWSNDNNDVEGPFWHGTHVAGIAGAYTDNQTGVAGVAGGWGQQNRGSKLLICGVGDDYPDGSILDDAILYAAYMGADVITMSLEVGESNAVRLAIAAAHNTYGSFIDCAAGNSYCTPVTFPANAQYVIAVGASNENDSRATFSACGDPLFVVAPKTNIWSTQKNNTYNADNGTSFAAPMVAGVAALLFSYNPSYTNSFIEEIIAKSAEKKGGYSYDQTKTYGSWDDEMGYGRLNAYYAVAPPEAPVLSMSGGLGDNPTLSWVDNEEPDIDHFVIKKKYTNDSGTMIQYVDPAPNPYTDPGITIQKFGNTIAEYWVKAVDITEQESPYSNKKSTWGIGPMWKEFVSEEGPSKYSLIGNYPNPFNPITTIRFDIPEKSYVNITIYALRGHTVKTLINEQEQAGFKQVTWNGTDNHGKPVASGVYIYTLSAISTESKQTFHQSRKLVLLR